jgi:hypothetical protein
LCASLSATSACAQQPKDVVADGVDAPTLLSAGKWKIRLPERVADEAADDSRPQTRSPGPVLGAPAFLVL